MSIRLRLTFWYAGVLLLGLVLFGTGMWWALRHRLMVEVDGGLARLVEGLRTVIELESGPNLPLEISEFAREVPNGIFIQVREANGAVILPAASGLLLPSPFTAGESGYRTVNRGGRAMRFYEAGIGNGDHAYSALVAAPLDDMQQVLRDFRDLLFLMVPGVLAIACLGGYWISRRALAPVDEITRVARSISVENLSRRLRVPRTGDELQRMSETWNEVLERLESAVNRIRQFTADASHELRTPVALIRATAELALRREREPEQYRKSLRDIEAEAERMTELTEALLAMARGDAGGSDMPLRPGDLNAIVAEIVRQNEAVAEGHGIRLAAELAAGPAIAELNETGMRRLIMTLLDNALKYTPAGGAVTLATAAGAEALTLSVRDTGPGIPAEAVPHIFERFYRADASRSSRGAGLGLSIAQMIAHAHGSAIELESRPGEGACFRVKLKAIDSRE